MPNRGVLTKILTVAGTVLIWLPIAGPLVFGVMHALAARRFMVDYLMPAELFPLVIAGGLLLVCAAILARSNRRMIIAGAAAAFILWFGFQWVAVVTGLASGEAEPSGWRWGLVLGGLALYVVSVIAIGVGGIRLWRELFRHAAEGAGK